MRKSLGDKRREIPLDRAQDILQDPGRLQGRRHAHGANGRQGRKKSSSASIFPTTHFGFRKITVERPLRLNFQASPERIARLEEEKGFQASGAVEEEGRSRREGAGRRPRAAGGDPHASANAAGHARSRTATSSKRLLEAAAKKAGVKLAGTGDEGHPLGPLRARRDGRHLPRQGRQPRARPGAARHGERSARRDASRRSSSAR